MIKQTQELAIQNNFNLKNVPVEIVPAARSSKHPFISVEELEAIRTERKAVPASKHGLETICGASCETGAQ